MPGIETLVWILSIAMSLITILGGVVWQMLRAEAKDHSEQISKKADTERLHEIENRWASELVTVREGNEKLINKLEQRHDREIDQLGQRLGEAIRSSETNILTQIRLMIQVINKGE